MRTPYQLSIRSIIRFESAIQDGDGEVLQLMLEKLSSGNAAALNQQKRKLVKTELNRRKIGDAAAWVSIAFSLLGFLSVILLS